MNIKVGSKVRARTVRGTSDVDGKVVAIHKGSKGDWYEVQPDDKSAKPFRTRLALVSLR